jgi:diguanylate cyclase (GGDEF)-like protein
MTITASVLYQSAIVAGALACGIGGSLAALRSHAQARVDRLALRLALAREASFVETSRRLAAAAGTSIEAVREEIDRAVRATAPGIDAVTFFEEREGTLVCVAAFGERVAYFVDARIARDDPNALIVRALSRGHRVTLGAECDARPLHPGDGFAAAVPLALEGGRVGVVMVAAAGGVAPESLDRIVTVFDQATTAYRIALDRADDRARAEYDGLTGLLTPRALRTRFSEAVKRLRYEPLGRLALLFVDIDHFKAWNDTYGHASGDALLRTLATTFREVAQAAGDLVGRNGGDEFCIVLHDTEKSAAIERAASLRATIAATDYASLLAQPEGAAVRISASIGVACFPADARTASDLLEIADAAMYDSKRGGRNAVSFRGVDGAFVRIDASVAVSL